MDGERRIFERFSAQFPAKFKDSRNPFGSNVFLQDASASGARFISSERLFSGDFVSLQVKLPHMPNPLELSGRIMWSRPSRSSMWETGLRFVEANFMKIQPIFKSTLQD